METKPPKALTGIRSSSINMEIEIAMCAYAPERSSMFNVWCGLCALQEQNASNHKTHIPGAINRLPGRIKLFYVFRIQFSRLAHFQTAQRPFRRHRTESPNHRLSANDS